MADVPETITVSPDGFSLPTSEILTGRGFVTGKSGSGKSNTASVVAEELLEHGLPMLVVDTDGEYYGLKGRYELLHVGADGDCDATVGVEHAEKLAELALLQHVPVVLDLSGFLEEAERRALLLGVLEHLFALGKRVRKPFLVFVEEIHEFLPQTGTADELSEMLVTVAKRGRKRGIGLCGMSQRPAAVDKDYITQCDWVVWHRLTWDNDKRVASQMLGSEVARDIDDLDTGEALVVTDWDDRVNRVRFRRKRTFDAGATPDLDDLGTAGGYEPVRTELLGELSGEDADLNEVDLESLAAGRRVPDPPAEPPARSLDEAAEAVLAERADGAEDDGAADDDEASGDARTLVAGSDPAEDGGRDVLTISSRPVGSSYAPPSPNEDESFDPVWELGHLVVFVVARLAGAVLGLVAAVVGAFAAAGRGLAGLAAGLRRRLVAPAAGPRERAAAGRASDRLVAVAVLVLLAAAGALLLWP